jgi:hypothetical protein
MTRDRKKEPILVISPDSVRKHIAMIWLIRAGEAFIIGPLLFLALMIGLGFVISINPFKPQAPPLVEIPGQPVASEIYSVIMCIIILGVGLFIGRKLIDRHLWPLVFGGLWRLVYVVVCRVLELKPPAPPASSKEPPLDPDVPEFPRKSPLVQM